METGDVGSNPFSSEQVFPLDRFGETLQSLGHNMRRWHSHRPVLCLNQKYQQRSDRDTWSCQHVFRKALLT